VRRVWIGVTVFAVWLLWPAAAFAHPFVPGEVPVDSAAVLTVDLAHGCVAPLGSHQTAAGEATREVAVRFPPEIDVRTVVDSDGFVTATPSRTDSFDEWTFTAPDGVDVDAPVLSFAVVVTASPQDTLWLQVLQICDTYTHRWVATPDEPAGEPGVSVRLTDADAAAPAAGAPPRDGEQPPTADASEEGEDSDDPLIDFIGVDIPQTADAWVWYVLIAAVVGVLLAKRSSRTKPTDGPTRSQGRNGPKGPKGPKRPKR
jgi:hypothetical protein